MKIGFLSDAHGNPFGFIRCLDLLRDEGVKNIIFLGDAVGYLPHGLDVLNSLCRMGIPCVKGNHEAMVLGDLRIPADKSEVYRLEEIRSNLPDSKREWLLNAWPERLEMEFAGKRLLLLHGRPADPLQGYLYENDDPFMGEVSGFDLIVMGHTHRPFIKDHEGTLLANVGSCGLPRDIGNLASCAIYDATEHHVRILRTRMNVTEVLFSCKENSVAPEVTQCLTRGGAEINMEGFAGGRFVR